MRLRLLLLLLMIVLLIPAAAAQEGADESPILDMLSRVPATPETRGDLIYFHDYRAIEQAYPGAEFFADVATFADDDNWTLGNDLWWLIWSLNSTAVATTSYWRSLDRMEALLGFDFSNLSQEMTFGTPPAQGILLRGDFDRNAVVQAHDQRGYTTQMDNDVVVMCPEAGCDTGNETDFENIEPGNIFGGNLGRNWPIWVDEPFVFGSSAFPLVDQVRRTQGGAVLPVASLGADERYQAAVEAVMQQGVLMQAIFMDAPLILSQFAEPDDPLLALGFDPSMTMEQREALIRELFADGVGETYQTLPRFSLMMMADVASETEQIGVLAFVYDDIEDATTAAEVIPQRIENYISLRARQPMTDILDDRRVEAVETKVLTVGDSNVLLVLFPTQKATIEEIPIITDFRNLRDTDRPNVTPPGLIFRLFSDMFVSRDMGWLDLTTRAELERFVRPFLDD